MALGAHVSTAGGLATCVPRAQALGAECIQIFLSPPQRWQAPKHSDEQVDEYTHLMADADIGPNFVHATYLVNLASADPGIKERTIQNLTAAAAMADRIGLAGIVVHVGSGRGQSVEDAIDQVSTALALVLANGQRCDLLLENSAGSGVLLG